MAIQQRLKKVVSFRTTSLIIMRMIEIGLKIGHTLRVQSKKCLRLKYVDQVFPVLYFTIFPDNTEQLKMYLFNRLLLLLPFLLLLKNWFQKNWGKHFPWKELNFLQCDTINLCLDALEVEILPGTFFSEAAKVASSGYLFSRIVENVRIEVTEKCFHQKLVVQINFYYTPVAN